LLEERAGARAHARARARARTDLCSDAAAAATRGRGSGCSDPRRPAVARRAPPRAGAGHLALDRDVARPRAVYRRRSRDPRGRGTPDGRAGTVPARCECWRRRTMTALPMTLMSDEEVAHFGRDAEAGFGALRTARGLLPLAAMDLDARVVGTIASI